MEDESQEATVGFADLGLRDELLTALDELGYEEPTPIQAATIPLLVEGNDLLGQAATGTGKTAAFALPILHQLEKRRGKGSGPMALVLVPTRELAMQVSEAIFKYGKHLDVRVVPIYGGQPIYRQFQQLERGVDVVVATPGRAIDHIGRSSLVLDDVQMVILDEADEMLDMGFADDLEAILAATPEERQTVLFSATMPARIASLAKKYQTDPMKIAIGAGDRRSDAGVIHQRAYIVQRQHKSAALGRILDMEQPTATIVFCRTRGEVDDLTVTMSGRGYRAEALHGGMDQQQRDRVMGRLRDGTAELLIATDVAARGIDVDTLTHVVNYNVPSAPDSYVHRIGRVGRAGREGVAITLAEPKEQRLLANIERLTKQKISLEAVPTASQLRVEQRARTAAAVAEAINEHRDVDGEGDSSINDDYGVIVDELAAEYDLRSIAIAALRMAQEATGAAGTDEFDIPDARRYDKGSGKGDHGAGRGAGGAAHRKGQGRFEGSFDDRARDNAEATGFVHLSLGRRAGLRPADLVGAIANEVGLPGREIGPIRIADQYSVVGIPERSMDSALDRLDRVMIRGKQVKVRRFVDRDQQGGGDYGGDRGGDGGGYRKSNYQPDDRRGSGGPRRGNDRPSPRYGDKRGKSPRG